jgi:hypothetical protein
MKKKEEKFNRYFDECWGCMHNRLGMLTLLRNVCQVGNKQEKLLYEREEMTAVQLCVVEGRKVVIDRIIDADIHCEKYDPWFDHYNELKNSY